MWWSGVVWSVAGCVVAVATATGLGVALVRVRRLHRTAIEERSWLLERERRSAAEAAVHTERARIAGELHDIVSHNVSVMVVQASAAREVLAATADIGTTALAAVEGAGRHALTELRDLLGLLAPSPNGDDDGADLSPQPGLGQIGPLVDRIAFAGLPVEVRISGEPRPLPPGMDLTAYRIVQEALTNALRYAGGASAQVAIRYAERYLRVEVLNSGPGVPGAPRPHPAGDRHGAGRGLLGLRERVAVYGGVLHAGRRLGGGYRVRARIPLERP